MKRFILMLFTWAIVINCDGQKSAGDYFQALPSPLVNPCDNDSSRAYYEQIGTVSGELSGDIKARKKEVKDFMKGHKAEMKETMIKNSGLTYTPEQMQKMKQDNKHMTQEQKMKLADEMMQQNANISMKEVQERKNDAKKKDTAAVKGWAMAVSTEKMADQPADQAKIEADQLKMKSLVDLSKEMSDIQAKLSWGGGKFDQQMDLLQKDADTAWAELQRRIEPFKNEIDGINTERERNPDRRNNEDQSKQDFEQIKLLTEQIHRLKYEYCIPLTPRYAEILNGLIRYLPGTFTDCDKVDQLNAEINYRQTGVMMPKAAIGLSALESVKNYADLLSKIQKFRIVAHPEIDYKGEIGAEQ